MHHPDSAARVRGAFSTRPAGGLAGSGMAAENMIQAVRGGIWVI